MYGNISIYQTFIILAQTNSYINEKISIDIPYSNYLREIANWTLDHIGSNLIYTSTSILSVSILSISILLFGVFIKHTGNFTRFLHRLLFGYFLYFLWLESTSILFRLEKFASLNTLEYRQEDSLFYRVFLLYSTIIVAIFFFGLAERFFLSKKSSREFPLLILFIYFAGLLVFRLHTLIDLLLALEIVTLSSYVLATFERQNRFSTFAGIQYFLLGSLPSARLILGFALFYLQGGSVVVEDLDLLFSSFSGIDSSFFVNKSYLLSDYFFNGLNQSNEVVSTYWYNISDNTTSIDTIDLFVSIHPITALTVRGLFLILFNLLFKITAAPFHIWAPSVYGNAPIASVTFLSIYSKALIFFFLFKLITTFLHVFAFIIFSVLLVLGLLSIFVGRVGAFTEKRIKRFFVYSSRGHVGFRLAGLSLFTLEGASASFQYLAIYIVSSFLRWFYPLLRGRDKHHLTHLVELKYTDPLLGFIFAILVFSRSGIPPLGGFFIKFDILATLLDDSHFFVNYILFFFSVASFFYYLRLIKILFFDKQELDNTITGVNTVAISFTKFHSSETPRHVGRIWLRVSVFLFLSFYVIIIQNPLLVLQQEALSYLF